MSYAKYNGVAKADIVKIDGAAVASIAKCDGVEAGAVTATNWVVAADDGHVFWCGADPTGTWTEYDTWSPSGTPRAFDIAAGKDANGNIIYVLSRDATAGELQVSSSDVTDGNTWTTVNLGSGDLDQYRIIWCDDGSTSGVWIASGRQTNDSIYRSTDGGANWSAVDISGLAGINSRGIQAMCFGNGVVMMAQDANIYTSTDYGVNWSASTPFAGNNAPTAARCLTYTNNSFVLIYGRLGEVRARSCADSDLTDWGDESTMNTDTRNPGGNFDQDKINVASANGRVAHITANDEHCSRFDVSGKTISNIAMTDLGMNSQRHAEDIETDGTTWLICSRLGDIWRSTDGAATWTKIKTDAGGNADHGQGICSNVLLPL